MSSFKRKLARQIEQPKSEADAPAEHTAGANAVQPRTSAKLNPRGNAPSSLDCGRVLRRKSAGR